MTVAKKPAVRGVMTEDESMRLPKDGRKWELVGGEAKEEPARHEPAGGQPKVSLLVLSFELLPLVYQKTTSC